MAGYKSKKMSAQSRFISTNEIIESLAWNDPDLVEQICAHEMINFLSALYEARDSLVNGTDDHIAMFSTNPFHDYQKIMNKIKAYEMVLEDFVVNEDARDD